MTEFKEHWTSRQVDSAAINIFSAVPGSYLAAIRDMAYCVTERLKGFPVSLTNLGWESGVVMVLVDMIYQKALASDRLIFNVTENSALRVAERLIELCKEHPREQA